MIFLYLFLIAGILFMLCGIFNKYLPKWFCDHMGWHLAPNNQNFDGCSFEGVCPRCKKKVLQDSQGNWFKYEN